MEKDDLPGAYWLALSLEKEGLPTFSPQILKALQGSWWLLSSDTIYFDELRSLALEEDPSEDEVKRMMALASALIPSLVSPALGLQQWLYEKTSIQSLNEVVATIREFTQLGIPFQSGDVKSQHGSYGRREKIQALVQEAKALREKAENKRFLFYRSTRIIRKMLAPGGDLGRILEIVYKDERESLKELEEKLARFEEKDQIKNHVYMYDTMLDVTQKNPIEGAALLQLIRYIIALLEPAHSWKSLVLAEKKIEREKDWYEKRIDELQKVVASNLPLIYEELQEICEQREEDKDILTALSTLKKSLERLASLLGLREGVENQRDFLSDHWWLQGAENLDVALARRLLWLPALLYDEEGLPLSMDYSSIEAIMSVPKTKEALFNNIEEWLKRKDFRFLETILSVFPKSEKIEEIKKRINNEREGLKETLREKIAGTEEIIERTFINGIITEEEKLDNAEKVSLIDADQVLNFQPHFEELNSIKESLAQALRERLQVLQEKWDKNSRLWLSSIDEEERGDAESFIHQSFKNGDSRIIEEFLASLQESYERGERFSFTGIHSGDSLFLDYLEKGPILEKESRRDPHFKGAMKAIQREKTWARIQFARLPANHRKQAEQALDAWIQLKNHKSVTIKDRAIKMEAILSFLGFIIEEDPQSFRLLQDEGHWIHALLKMSASDQARPFPQFGSLTYNQYNVICLWEKPGADTISSLLHDTRLDVQYPIIFYFGFLSNYKKERLLKMNREKSLVVAIMDEILFLYLLGVRDHRLKTLLHSTLPYSSIVPYTPKLAGDVPPELFYGRKDSVIELQRSEGSCLVYGGRQMGKSALLRHVQRRTHNPSLQSYAKVEDIKLLGNPVTGEKAEKLWDKIKDIFVNWGLLEPSKIYEEDTIIHEIGQVMESNPALKTLIMLDEADELLNYDSEQGFKIVTKIRQLMGDSNRRFKVVFTGLHNVQRFHSLSNQPLPHFGSPILVGPLKKEAAFNLIAEPLKALGFDVDQAVVLLILSYTNYHPGLIHLFCTELIKRLYGQAGRFRADSMGRVKITREDVESVYLNEDVRKQIKERFELTLALDPRYQVIAWSMVADQTSMRDSYGHPYTVGEILSHVTYWWEAEFSKMRNNELKGLLDELCGLGVLSLTTDERYRLRSPNLVRLMGTEQDIEERLLEYADKPAMKEEHPHSFHLLLDREKGAYSPFTFEQARNLNTSYADLRIITISKALGEEVIVSAIKNLGLNFEGGREEYIQKIPDSIKRGDDLIDWLEGLTEKEDALHSVFYHFPGEDIDDLEGKIQKTRILMQQKKKENQKSLRLYFIMDPALYWKWLRKGLLFEELESTGLVTAVGRWDTRAIAQRLNHSSKLDSSEICKTLMEVSGGWPILLDRIMEECGASADPTPAALKIKKELLEGDLKEIFISSLQLPNDLDFWKIFKWILKEKEFLAEMIQPQEMGVKDITPVQCRDALLFLQQFDLLSRDGEIYKVEKVVERILHDQH